MKNIKRELILNDSGIHGKMIYIMSLLIPMECKHLKEI